MIYLDNAATTGKKPATVIRAMEYAMKNYSANPGRSGHTLSANTAEAVYRVREKTADFFGATGADRVCFTLNCTHSINCVLKGVLRKGDHVIVSDMEHNAVMRPLKKTGISFSKAEVSLTDDKITLSSFERLIKPNTKMIFCTGASNVLGKILPIRQIGELCKRKGLLFGVDAAQIAGVVPLNMKEMNIDYLCIAPHKGLYAPMGLGVLICEKGIENTILEGGTGSNSIEMFQPQFLPERLESGTINVPSIMALGAGIDYVKNIGIKKLYEGEMGLTARLYSGLKNIPNIKLYTPNPINFGYAPVLSFNIENMPSADLAEQLSEKGFAVRGGLHCAPTAHAKIGTLPSGTVRVSVASFNTIMEIESFLKAVGQMGFKKVKNS